MIGLIITSIIIALVCLMMFTSLNENFYFSLRDYKIDAAVRGLFLIPLLFIILGITIAICGVKIRYEFTKESDEKSAFLLLGISTTVVLYSLGIIIMYIVVNGAGAITWEFLTENPRKLGTEGGIFPCIIGTLYLVIGAIVVALPLGMGTAIFLTEYQKEGKITKTIRVAVNSLSGVPSIVFGLFGLALFVPVFGVSLLSGSMILGFMILPTIIRTTEESLKAVPMGFREGSLALGATKWQTIKKVVLPPAMPGCITGTILGIGRAAGETAPIMWTAVVFFGGDIPTTVFDPVMALPYHLLELTKLIGYKDVAGNAWGTALVLLMLVLSINVFAVALRNHYKKKMRW